MSKLVKKDNVVLYNYIYAEIAIMFPKVYVMANFSGWPAKALNNYPKLNTYKKYPKNIINLLSFYSFFFWEKWIFRVKFQVSKEF